MDIGEYKRKSNQGFQKGHPSFISKETYIKIGKKISLKMKGRKLSENHKKKISEVQKGKKASEETKKKMSETHKRIGTGKWMKGRKLSEETKKKLSLVLTGKKRSLEIKQKLSLSKMGNKNFQYGKSPSEETRKKLSELAKKRQAYLPLMTQESREKSRLSNLGKPKLKNRGANCYLWKGGITPINQAIRMSLEYKLWREAVFKKDNYTCVWCKKKGVYLNADHIKMFAFHLQLRFEVLNGRTLCENCHKWKTKWDMKIYTGKVPKLNYVARTC